MVLTSKRARLNRLSEKTRSEITRHENSSLGVHKEELDPILREMAKLQSAITELEGRYGKLKEEAFPLIEAAGDMYEVDGIKAQIVRSQIWQVDAVELLKKFGSKVHGLLTISASKFRKAFEADTLGTKTELKGIARLVDQTPRFLLLQK